MNIYADGVILTDLNIRYFFSSSFRVERADKGPVQLQWAARGHRDQRHYSQQTQPRLQGLVPSCQPLDSMRVVTEPTRPDRMTTTDN